MFGVSLRIFTSVNAERVLIGISTCWNLDAAQLQQYDSIDIYQL